jgi:HEAT repeat protein
MRFAHPILGGYLTGKVLGSVQPEKILDLPNWSGKYLAMNYFAALGDAEQLASKLLDIPDRPLERNILIVARWLRYSQQETKWRNKTMENLVRMLRIPDQPLGFRGQILSAILQSGEAGVPLLLRQMLSSDDPELLQLCILGCATIKDTKSVESIAKLLNHSSPNVYKAACLALVKIGTRTALDLVASVLLHGDESSRTSAAMSLALNFAEGHEMLREGASMDDIMVRRAVTYGLGVIDELWATEILTKMQLEDNQWIVRNAATEVLDNKQNTNRYIPKRLPPPSECPWLIAFAGKKGVGISPNSPATDILLMALTGGDEAEQLASLDYLRAFSSSNVFAIFYKFLYGNNVVLREAIFRTIWEMASRGVIIPDPQQFGVNY